VKTANAGTLPEDFEANQRAHERLIDNLRDVQRELSVAASDEAFYHQQALSGGADEAFGAVITPRRRIEMLELQLAEYRSRGFTLKHPDVIAANEEIAGLKKEIEAGAEDPNNLSAAQQNARFEMQRASLRKTASQQELNALRAQLAALEDRLAKTPRVAEQLAALEREHEHLFDAYQEFSKKRLEAGVAADMESRQKGEKFRVLEQAVPPQEASAPNRPMLLGIGLLLGLGLAVAYAAGAETLDASFHTPRRLQERLGLPVLAAISPVLLASDLAARRARNLRRGLLASAITLAVLIVSAAGYWWQGTRSAAAGVPAVAQAG